MELIRFLLQRYLFPKRSSLLTLALWICVAGVAVGVIQLMVVLSVMSGFQRLLRENYTKITSDIVVVPKPYRLSEASDIADRLKGLKELEAVSPFSLGAGMIIKQTSVGGVILEGIDLKSSSHVTPWEEIWVESPVPTEKLPPNWIWIGTQLAKKMHIKNGDTVQLLIPESDGRKLVPFIVTAQTQFGIYHHDLHQAYIDLRQLSQLFPKTGGAYMYKVKVRPNHSALQVAESIKKHLGGVANIKLWSDIHQNIFLAVEHQKKLLFLVLEILVALAAVNVVNLLLMNAHHRRKDVAILRAMGMHMWKVFTFFLCQGCFVGLIGVVAGIAGGIFFCLLIERFQPTLLSESIYNTTRLPVELRGWDVGLIAAGALIVCLIFSIGPALRTALRPPVEALRHE